VVDDERKVGGRSSQTRGPETAKLRDPYVVVLVLGTIISPRAAERRQRRPVLAATRIQQTLVQTLVLTQHSVVKIGGLSSAVA